MPVATHFLSWAALTAVTSRSPQCRGAPFYLHVDMRVSLRRFHVWKLIEKRGGGVHTPAVRLQGHDCARKRASRAPG